MIISGIVRLGKDANVRYTANAGAVTNLSGVYNYGIKQQDGSYLSQWVELTLWGKQAEVLAQYLTKGSQAFPTSVGMNRRFAG